MAIMYNVYYGTSDTYFSRTQPKLIECLLVAKLGKSNRQ